VSLRWRAYGELVCAAKFPEEPDDCYIDDRLHYQLSVISRCIVADVNHEQNGLWYWVFDGNGGPYLRGQLEPPAQGAP